MMNIHEGFNEREEVGMRELYLNGMESSSFQLGLGPSATEVAADALWNITST